MQPAVGGEPRNQLQQVPVAVPRVEAQGANGSCIPLCLCWYGYRVMDVLLSVPVGLPSTLRPGKAGKQWVRNGEPLTVPCKTLGTLIQRTWEG